MSRGWLGCMALQDMYKSVSCLGNDDRLSQLSES